jgi:hypothetical protein
MGIVAVAPRAGKALSPTVLFRWRGIGDAGIPVIECSVAPTPPDGTPDFRFPTEL